MIRVKGILSRSTTKYWLEQFIDEELKPALRGLISKENLIDWRIKHSDLPYMYVNVEHILQAARDGGVIKIEGTPQQMASCRVIYEGIAIPYSTFWHGVQKVVKKYGFRHVGHKRYKYDVSKAHLEIAY